MRAHQPAWPAATRRAQAGRVQARAISHAAHHPGPLPSCATHHARTWNGAVPLLLLLLPRRWRGCVLGGGAPGGAAGTSPVALPRRVVTITSLRCSCCCAAAEQLRSSAAALTKGVLLFRTAQKVDCDSQCEVLTVRKCKGPRAYCPTLRWTGTKGLGWGLSPIQAAAAGTAVCCIVLTHNSGRQAASVHTAASTQRPGCIVGAPRGLYRAAGSTPNGR